MHIQSDPLYLTESARAVLFVIGHLSNCPFVRIREVVGKLILEGQTVNRNFVSK